jgi:hypothetical protein
VIDDAGTDSPASAEAPSLAPTGHPEVDAVLASLEALHETPVAEHAAVFEAAHDRLRAVLSEGAEAPTAG